MRARWARPLALMGAVLLVVSGAVAQQETEDDLQFVEELRRAFRRGGSFSAQRDLREYLEDFPGSTAARRLAAHVALGRGQMAEAEAHLDAADGPDAELLGRVLLRTDRNEEALELSRGGILSPLAAAVLEVDALDALGRLGEARRRAREASDGADSRELSGRDMLCLGRLLLFQRRFELANQALVFADADLNGKRGPGYRLVEPEVAVLLGEVYGATRQGGAQEADPALTVLNEVLEVDSGHPAALTAKALVYLYGMNGRKAEVAWSRALARDPTYPDALVLMGTARLLDRRVEAALEAAQRVLAALPRHRDALALRAAALALAGRADEAQVARERFDRYHPESGVADFVLGRVLQAHYRFEESIVPLERALATDPDDPEPLPVLAQSLAHVGRETEARAVLEEHARLSPWPYPWRTNMLGVLARLKESVEIQTEAGFLLRLPPGEQDVTGVLLADVLARARADMAERWGYEPGGEVLVEVFDHHADFSVRTVGFSGFMALGACFGEVMTMLSPLCEMRGRFHWAQTAVHEYAHVVTLGLSRNRVPRWLTEGVSVVEEKRVHPAWARELEREVLNARANGTILSVERLDEAFRDGSTIALGYYQGSLVCEVVEQDFGFEGLRALVQAYAEDRSTRAAIREALKIEAEELDERVRVYIDAEVATRARVRPRYSDAGKEHLRRRVAAGDATALAELARAYFDLGRTMDAQIALQRAEGQKVARLDLLPLQAEMDRASGQVEEAVKKLREWWEGGKADADGLRRLAGLLFTQGEDEEGMRALQASVALFEGDTDPHGAPRRLLRRLDRDGNGEAWREAVERLCLHDETDLVSRLALGRWLWEQGQQQEGLRWLLEAVDIDPYRPDLRMEVADRLVELGDVQAAGQQWSLVLATRAEQVPEQAGIPLEDLWDRARRLGQDGVSGEP